MRFPRSLLALIALVLAAGSAEPEDGGEQALKRVRDDLQRRINESVDRGVEALREMQRDGGAFPYGDVPFATNPAIHQGATALACLALLHAGVPPDDPAVTRGVTWILRVGRGGGILTHHRYVYANGLVIWLLASVDARLYRPEITRLAARLARGATSDGYWGYYAGPVDAFLDSPNLSTTQLAVLGMWEAEKAGIRMPERTWARIERTLVNRQRADGGWSYRPNGGISTFSCSAIGTASLVLARAAQERDEDARRAVMRSREVVRGLAKLADSFDEALSPRWTSLDVYGLYAAERAGIVAGVERFGRREWYAAGARKLLENQREDGRWEPRGDSRHPAAVATAFALLFLTRATTPVVTTGGDDPNATAGGIRTGGAQTLGEKAFEDVVDALLREMATGERPAGALGKLEELAPRVLPVLVARLEAGDAEFRRAAVTGLRALTGERHGFDPDGPGDEREKAAARWRDAMRD